MDPVNPNRKASIALASGVVSVLGLFGCAAAFFGGPWWDDHGGLWLLMVMATFFAALLAVFLGTLGWIDVRRGVSSQRVNQAQWGIVLGGSVSGFMFIGTVVLIVIFMVIFGSDGTGGFD